MAENGHLVSRSALGPLTSSYVQYLPGIYQSDPFIGRFLMIFESILDPIERSVDHLEKYFDPRLTPAQLLPWLASWVDLELNENWPLAKQRELVAWAATLYRWRGTRRALRQHMKIYAGYPPLIVENFDGIRLGQDACMGVNTMLGSQRNHTLMVHVVANDPSDLDEDIVRQIVEIEKPAHVAYLLEIVSADKLMPAEPAGIGDPTQ